MPEFAPAVLPRFDDYETICRKFQWHIPPDFNIAVAVCDRWAEREPDRVAIVHQHADGRCEAVSYGALRELSNRLANTLRAHGIGRGDRVALLLPQMPEVAAVHIAIYKLGAIALPLAALFGPDAISYQAAGLRRQGADHRCAGPHQARRSQAFAGRARAGALSRRCGSGRARFS